MVVAIVPIKGFVAPRDGLPSVDLDGSEGSSPDRWWVPAVEARLGAARASMLDKRVLCGHWGKRPMEMGRQDLYLPGKR